MFFKSHYGPSIILEILWELSSRTPVSKMPKLICVLKDKSEFYKWVDFFRDVAGWVEDTDRIIMGGTDAVVEADGT